LLVNKTQPIAYIPTHIDASYTGAMARCDLKKVPGVDEGLITPSTPTLVLRRDAAKEFIRPDSEQNVARQTRPVFVSFLRELYNRDCNKEAPDEFLTMDQLSRMSGVFDRENPAYVAPEEYPRSFFPNDHLTPEEDTQSSFSPHDHMTYMTPEELIRSPLLPQEQLPLLSPEEVTLSSHLSNGHVTSPTNQEELTLSSPPLRHKSTIVQTQISQISQRHTISQTTCHQQALLSTRSSTEFTGFSGLSTGVSGSLTGASGPSTGVSGLSTGMSGPSTGLSGPLNGLSGPSTGMSISSSTMQISLEQPRRNSTDDSQCSLHPSSR